MTTNDGLTTNDQLQCVGSEFRAALEARLSGDRSGEFRLPGKDEIATFCRNYVDALFPLFHAPPTGGPSPLILALVDSLENTLAEQLVCAIRFDCNCRGKSTPPNVAGEAEKILAHIRKQLPKLAQLLATDLMAALANDPAASGLEEILLGYPGIEAITIQRFAHELYLLKVPYLPRMMTEVAHSDTGIDIHPGATIDESFFIDHGTGVVIGETATIGKHVTLYHGVTLGAFNPVSRRDSGGELVRGIGNKRHPDIEDNVTIYSGASIIGGDTRVGHHSIIGGNVWLTRSVAPYSRVSMKDPELVIRSQSKGSDEEWFLGSSI